MKHPAASLAAVVALFASLAGAVAFLAINKWFGAGDLTAMFVWSLPLAALVYFSFRSAGARLATASATWRYSALVLLGASVGSAWALVAAIALGGWIAAFSFPVLFCWIAGGTLAGTAAAWLFERRTWPVAIALVLVVGGVSHRLNVYALTPEPRVRVVLASGSSADQDRIWEVVSRPGRRAGESFLLDGISSAGFTTSEADRPVFTVTFWKGIGRDQRDSLIAHIGRSRLVDRVDVIP